MFWSRYAATQLRHPRVLCSFSRERGVTIEPKPFGTPPPEIVHQHSHIVPLPAAGKVMVIEWTGDNAERHLVDLNL